MKKEKINLNISSIYNIIIYFSLIIIIFFFYKNLLIYKGFKFYYLLFSFVSIGYLYNCLIKKSSFFHIFLSIFIFLGFWFKYSLNTLFNNLINGNNYYAEGTGNFSFLANDIDKVILIATVAILSFWISFLITNFYKKKDVKKKIIILSNTEEKIFIISFFFLCLINFFFKIYIKGYFDYKINHIFYFFFSFFYQVGALIILGLYLDLKIDLNKKITKEILIAALLILIYLYSSISRNIFIFLPFVFTFFVIFPYFKIKINLSFFVKLIIMILVCFFIFLSVNFKRITINKSEAANLNEFPISYSLFQVIKNRFVGIDALMAVYSYKEKSFNFYFESWKNKDKFGSLSFFDSKILNSQISQVFNNNFVTLPGIIAHSYYTGSIFFVFSVCLAVSSFFSYIEKFLLNRLGYPFVVAVISFIIVYRLIHFGYNPINSYFLITAIFLAIAFIKFYEFLKKK